METRQITQVHVFFVVLNNIYGRFEDREIVAVSDDYQKLLDFYYSNLLPENERFRDEQGMYRSFANGPFYNYNPIMCEYDGFKDEWVSLEEYEKIKSRYYFI